MSESAQEKMARAVQEQQAQWSAFAAKALDSSMKLFELNLKMAKQSLEDTSQSARHVLSVKSPEDIFKVESGTVLCKRNWCNYVCIYDRIEPVGTKSTE